MERKPCDPGFSWDILLNCCISHKTMGLAPSGESRSAVSAAAPPPALKPVLSNRGLDESAVSVSLWVCVGLVASGSVLVLLLWFSIYRQHIRTSQNTGEKDSTPHTPTTVEQEEETLEPWTHCNGQTQDGPIRVQVCGWNLCDGCVEHVRPLPATELGDSALVTAKTGQPVEVTNAE